MLHISELSLNNSAFPCISIWDISDKLIYKTHVIFKSNSFFAVLLASNFRTGRPIVLSFLFFLLSSKPEALPGVLGNRKQGHLFHEKHGNICVKNEGNSVINAILGNREIKIKILINRGTKQFFFGEQGNRYPPHTLGLMTLGSCSRL